MISLKATLEAIKTKLSAHDKALSVDYIVEQGTSGIWTYRKWNSGIAECWGTTSASSSSTYTQFIPAYPSNLFVELPIAMVSGGAESNASAYAAYVRAYAKDKADIYVYTSGSKPAWIYIHAIGKWK